MPDIYVVVRKDIAPGRKCAQVAHAVAGLAYTMSQAIYFDYYDAVFNGRLIVLEADEPYWLNDGAGCHYTFFEPDFGGIATATAYYVEEEMRDAFAGMKLAYPRKKWWKRERYNYY